MQHVGRWSVSLLSLLGIRVTVGGTLNGSGLLVANHIHGSTSL